MKQPKVAIIILNWNGLEDTIECLDSLDNVAYTNYEIVVIDNGSRGDEALALEIIADDFGNGFHLIKNRRNYGGSGGYNIGIRYILKHSDAEYLLILDNDTIVSPDFLDEMVEVFQADSSIGIASAMIYHYDKLDKLHIIGDKIELWKVDYHLTLGLIFKTIKKSIFGGNDIYKGQYDTNNEVEHIGFWCALFDRKMVEDIGLFNEEYVGFESIDYSLRVRGVGQKVVYIPDAKVWHKFRSKNRMDGVFQYYGSKSLFQFMKHYATKWQYRCFLIQFFSVHFCLATAYYLIWCHCPRVFLSFCKGVRDGLFNIKGGLA